MSVPLDPRLEFLEGVSFDDISIKEYPKLAFFCGGPPTSVFDQNANKTFYHSLRAYIYALLDIEGYTTKCKNAEDIKEWNHYNIYSDLIEFEKDIAHICRSIILFVESAGSIAELGSFSMIPEISKKLQVFIQEKHFTGSSFIDLGPLLKLKNINTNSVHAISWNTLSKKINGNTIEVFDDLYTKFSPWKDYICDQIKQSIEHPDKNTRDPDEIIRAKEILFIYDLVVLFHAVTDDEINDYFKTMSYVISQQKIERAIFCLTKLELLKTNPKGNRNYLTPVQMMQQRYTSISRPADKKQLNDTARLDVKILKYYEHRIHVARRSAIDEIES